MNPKCWQFYEGPDAPWFDATLAAAFIIMQVYYLMSQLGMV